MEQTELRNALHGLMLEAYGALGWLNGVVQLSDRARVYKAEKLTMALANAEEVLTPQSEMEAGEVFRDRIVEHLGKCGVAIIADTAIKLDAEILSSDSKGHDKRGRSL